MTDAGESGSSEDVDNHLQDQNSEATAQATSWPTVAEVMALRPENGVLPILKPAHAIIPIPPPRSAPSTRVWHYGWPIGIAFVHQVITHFVPDYDLTNVIGMKLALMTIMLKHYLGLNFEVNFAYVEPDDAEWSPEPLYPEDPGLGFIAFISTRPSRRLRKRLSQEQMDKMIRTMDGELPRWMEEAREKDGIFEERPVQTE